MSIAEFWVWALVLGPGQKNITPDSRLNLLECKMASSDDAHASQSL